MNRLEQYYKYMTVAYVYSEEKNMMFGLSDLRIFNEKGVILSTDAFISDNVENVNFEGKILLKRKEDYDKR